MPTEVPQKWFLTSKQAWAWLFTVIPLFLPLVTIATGKTINATDLGAIQTAGASVLDSGLTLAGSILGFIALVERMVSANGLDGLKFWVPKAPKPAALPAA
jgi:hypothetical protein